MKLKQGGGGDESSLKALINEVILSPGYDNDSCHLLSFYCIPYILKNFMYILIIMTVFQMDITFCVLFIILLKKLRISYACFFPV